MAGDGGEGVRRREFQLDAATITENNDTFLSRVHDEMHSKITLQDGAFSRSLSSSLYSQNKIVETGQLEMSGSWTNSASSTSVHKDSAGQVTTQAAADFSRGIISRDSFTSTLDDKVHGQRYTSEGTFYRHWFSPHIIDSTTKDGSGRVVQTSHASISSAGFFSRNIDMEYKDATGKKLGESHSLVTDGTHFGTMLLIGSGVTTLGGAAFGYFTGNWKRGLVVGAIGLGLGYASYKTPGYSVETDFKRY